VLVPDGTAYVPNSSMCTVTSYHGDNETVPMHSTPVPVKKRLRLSLNATNAPPQHVSLPPVQLSPIPEVNETASTSKNAQASEVKVSNSTPRHSPSARGDPHRSNIMTDGDEVQCVDVSSSEVSAENDKCSFESIADGRKLTDKDIDAFQQLVRTAYPNVKGLQTPLLQQCNKFQTFSKGPMLQILHEKLRKHWVLVALRTEAEQPVVEVYDSVYTTVSDETMLNICRIVDGGSDSMLTVRLMNVQRQRGNTDCGVFVCAYMERIVRGEEVVGVVYDTNVFRPHLVRCLSSGILEPFPCFTARICRKPVLTEKVVSVVCICRKPWNGELVVECTGCGVYFHPFCACIDDEYVESSRVYYCSACC